MERRLTRRRFLALAPAGTAGLAGCLGDQAGPNNGETGGEESDPDAEVDDWRTAELEDVQTQSSFTVGEFDRPALVHTFALWCNTCLNQQKEMSEVIERTGEDVKVVAINIDENEDPDAVREHVEDHDFDWRFTVPPSSVTRSLVDEFGEDITVAPRGPVIVVCRDGEARLIEEIGVKSADELEAALAETCG